MGIFLRGKPSPKKSIKIQMIQTCFLDASQLHKKMFQQPKQMMSSYAISYGRDLDSSDISDDIFVESTIMS
jgi:hypothetical protein